MRYQRTIIRALGRISLLVVARWQPENACVSMLALQEIAKRPLQLRNMRVMMAGVEASGRESGGVAVRRQPAGRHPGRNGGVVLPVGGGRYACTGLHKPTFAKQKVQCEWSGCRTLVRHWGWAGVERQKVVCFSDFLKLRTSGKNFKKIKNTGRVF